jgi:peptidoglycan/LPS O-acetylase OafA/YrhL
MTGADRSVVSTRQRLNRRILRGWLLFLALAFAVGLTVALQLQSGKTLWLMAMVVIGFALYILSICRTPCLHCRKALGWRALAWIPPNALNNSPPCPRCGESIDAEVPTH